MTTTPPNTASSSADEPTMPLSRAFIDALDTTPPADFGDLPVSVWATAQASPAAQRKGRYVPESTAHPAKMLPAVAAHAIEHYTKPGEVVLDPMCGIGTTLIEAIDLGRRAVGVEYEPHWADIARANLRFARERGHDHDGQVVRGDARQLARLLPAEYVGQVALVVTSPPYGPSVHGLVNTNREPGIDKVSKRHYRYGSALDRGNLANIGHHRLLVGFTRILTACARVVRPGGHVAITVRPWREHAELVDLPSQVVACGAAAGLIPVERCVALLARVADTELVTRGSFFQRDFIRKQRDAGLPLHLIAHEDVVVFREPRTRSSSEKPKQVQTEPEHAPGSLSGLDARVRKGSEGAAA
ncbi:site-specific DNA-methyltransferase [Amycolatopsis balhimycina DSM 5908]|uniref:Methyltransferase n=2 Tax=Amycolatopsis balhimycina TaxID=208443 RepID=A0A428W460_AMYBA|nr:site-specific DNA-methyltransferase [Amycolatopsis balhimycina]RSM37882.1 site-specific DNA-methyltransferase [Amycolatopsis balhimycina DSM 5908]